MFNKVEVCLQTWILTDLLWHFFWQTMLNKCRTKEFLWYVCLGVGKNGRESFISCHGKLTVYLKEFTRYHLKSNAGSLSANRTQDGSWRSDLLPWSHPEIDFKGLSENVFSLNNSTREHSHHGVFGAYHLSIESCCKKRSGSKCALEGNGQRHIGRVMTQDLCGLQKNTCPHPSYSGLDRENYSISLMEKKNRIVEYTKIHSPSPSIYWATTIVTHYQRSSMVHTVVLALSPASWMGNTRMRSCTDHRVRPFKGMAGRERNQWEEENRYKVFQRRCC